MINQRNASTTTNNGFGCDRWQQHFGNTDESPTLSQADVASGTEPYNIGLRKSLKLTNGNQTSGGGSTDYMWIRYRGEARDMVCLLYTSPSPRDKRQSRMPSSA